MQFNSFIFLLFFIVITLIYYLVSASKRNLVLLAANYLFYCYFDYRFAALLLTLTSFTYLIGNKIYDTQNFNHKRNLVLVAIIVNLVVLGFFKYFNFFAQSFSAFSEILGFGINTFTLNLILPLGISFYVFQTLTYIFDLYYENISDKYGFTNFAVFASFFPTVVAGPIERASRLLPQISNERLFNNENIKLGTSLIVMGLFRKVLIGDSAGKIVNHIFAEPRYYTSIELFTAIILYSIQIYNDFIGYSNMARGVAKILGFDIFINFKQPYFATSVADFWRRWHISLSLWLKDFLFVPLQIKFRNYKVWGNVIALMITFTLCGLWHGSSWTFIFWGFLHGFYMSFALLFSNQKKSFRSVISSSKVLMIIQMSTTYFLITFAWIFFRAENFESAFLILSGLFELSSGEFAFRFLKILLSYLVVSFFLDYLETRLDTDAILLKFKPAITHALTIVILMIVFAYLLTSDKAPFIYAQF